MKIAVQHQLSLNLGAALARSAQHVLLIPQSGAMQNVVDWAVEMPGVDTAARFIDSFGNRALLVTQLKPEPELVVTVSGVVETIDRNGVAGRPSGECPPAVYKRITAATKAPAALTSKFRSAPKAGGDRIALLHGLMGRVRDVLGGGEVVQSQSQGEAEQSQSQSSTPAPIAADYAHAFIGAARALDVPARYVTGYLAHSEEHEAAFHAWAEAWDDGLGWIAFDPMLNYCPTDHHVRVAVGLDAASTMPVRSVPVGAAKDVAMSVSAQ